ncbi:9632_t:CDS:10 [Paraglomus occultum]|uniref:9632_t:CDS:1 n=1 Tax=Paraglomus occultum TaxID=144539 RepID=A0A9N8WS04_9GLOM|nr:9632_t:CDS:10 [Paraglomus occultum]
MDQSEDETKFSNHQLIENHHKMEDQFTDPLSVSTNVPQTSSSSSPSTPSTISSSISVPTSQTSTNFSQKSRQAPSHWQKLRELVLVDQIPEIPRTSSLVNLEDNHYTSRAVDGNYGEQKFPFGTGLPGIITAATTTTSTTATSAVGSVLSNPSSTSTLITPPPPPKSLKFQYQSRRLRFKTTVQQQSDTTVGEFVKGAKSGSGEGMGENVNFYGELMEVLKRWKHVVKLAAAQEVFAELARPFFNYPVNVDDCNQALNIFEYIRINYRPSDPNVAGTLVSIDPDEMSIGNARVQIHKYDSLARCVFLEGLVKCCLVKDGKLRRYVMGNLIEKYWVTPDPTMKSLYEHVIQLFAHASFGILTDLSSFSSPPSPSIPHILSPTNTTAPSVSPSHSLAYLILKTLHNNISPETLKDTSAHVVRSLVSVAVCVLAVYPPESTSYINSKTTNSGEKNDAGLDNYSNKRDDKENEGKKEESTVVITMAKKYVEGLWICGWQHEVIMLVKEAIEQDTLERIVFMYNHLAFGINESIGTELVKETISDLFAKLSRVSPTSSAVSHLSKLLLSLSTKYRPSFYKPILACVASDSEERVAEYLHLIVTLRRYMTAIELWMQDREFLCTVLLSDVGSGKSGNKGKYKDVKKKSGSEKQDQNANGKQEKDNEDDTSWGSTTLGQCVIAMEFVWAQYGRARGQLEVAIKFLCDLERKLAIFITAKEKHVQIPIPLRLILCTLFLDLRLLCRQASRPGWLTRIINWLIYSSPGTVTFREIFVNKRESNRFPADVELQHISDQLDEVEMILTRIRVVYAAVDDLCLNEEKKDEMSDYLAVPTIVAFSSPSNPSVPLSPYNEMRRRSMLAPSSTMTDSPDTNASSSYRIPGSSSNSSRPPGVSSSHNHIPLLDRFTSSSFSSSFSASSSSIVSNISFPTSLSEATLTLLVAVFTSLSSNEYSQMAPYLWNRFLNDRNHKSFELASFLFVQCGEKAPEIVSELIKNDLYSSNPLPRTVALLKLSSFFAHRHTILSPPFLSPSSRRRLIRFQVPQIPFIPTDIGTSDTILYDSARTSEVKSGSSLPAEVRKRIQDLGWEEQDEQEQDRWKRLVTPLSLLPTFYLEDVERQEENENGGGAEVGIVGMSKTSYGEDENTGNKVGYAEGKIKVNRNRPLGDRDNKGHSNTNNAIQPTFNKKRAVTLPLLSLFSLSLVDLLDDTHGGVYALSKEVILYFLRDDPSLFLRLYFSELGLSSFSSQKALLTKLRHLLSMQHVFPPGFSHTLFNHLAGILKWHARDSKIGGFRLMCYVMPVLADLVPTVNEMTVRDFRKNKIEHILLNNGSIWFSDGSPAEMFPRNAVEVDVSGIVSGNESDAVNTGFELLGIDKRIFSIYMLRIGHILFMNNFLISCSKEAYSFKKWIEEYTELDASEEFGKVRGKTKAGVEDEKEENNENETYFPDPKRRSGWTSCSKLGSSSRNGGHDEKRLASNFWDDGNVKEYEKHKDRNSFNETSANDSNDCTSNVKSRIDLEHLSALRARAWNNLIYSLIKSLNRNYNDRAELTLFLNGVNKILLRHSTDYGIVGQSLVLYLNAALHFDRLFDNNKGYAIFIPAVFKVYCESETSQAIRAAITYAWSRFYKFHEESFVFQSLGCLTPLILRAYSKSRVLGEWMSQSLFELLKSLSNTKRLPDSLGIQDDLYYLPPSLTTIPTLHLPISPSALLSNPLVRKAAITAANASKLKPELLGLTEEKYFLLDDLFRLFMTIIAYDTGSVRAEQFVMLLRGILGDLIRESNSLAMLVEEGMAALCEVFLKFAKSGKGVAVGSGISGGNGLNGNVTRVSIASTMTSMTSDVASDPENSFDYKISEPYVYGKQWPQNDRVTIKLNFLHLIRVYSRHGGRLSDASHSKLSNIIRLMLKDYANAKALISTGFIAEYIKDVIVESLSSFSDSINPSATVPPILPTAFSLARPIDEGRKSILTLLRNIAPLFRQYYKSIDFSGVLDGLTAIIKFGNGMLVRGDEIASIIKEKFVVVGLSAALKGDWDDDDARDLRLYQTRFIDSLVKVFVALMIYTDLDMMSDLKKYPPSARIIERVIIPIIMEYKDKEVNERTPNATGGSGTSRGANASGSNISNTFMLNPPRISRISPQQKYIANWLSLIDYIIRSCTSHSITRSKTSAFNFLNSSSTTIDQINSDIETDEKIETRQEKGDKMDDISIKSDSRLSRLMSVKDNTPNTRISVAQFIISFTALKIALIRGEKWITKVPGMWLQISQFIRKTLGPASSIAGGVYKYGQWSRGSTPNTSTHNLATNVDDSQPHSLNPASAFDFVTWTLLELLVSYRLPLNLYLRTFIHQKIGGGGSWSRHGNEEGITNMSFTSASGSQFPSIKRQKWRSWGGPPVINTSSEDSIGNGLLFGSRNGSDTNLSDSGRMGDFSNNDRNSFTNSRSKMSLDATNPNYVVHMYMGYGMPEGINHLSDTQNKQELRQWQLKDALDKLETERKIVVEGFSNVFWSLKS